MAVSTLAADIEAVLDLAAALHRRGEFDEARRLYRQVLEWLPGHFQALHLLGGVEAQTNHPERAADVLSA